MIRLLLRTAGFVLLAAAFASLVVDGTRSIAAQHLLQFSLADTAAWLLGGRFMAALQSVLQWPAAAQRIALGLLSVPSWITTGTLGLFLLYAGRPSAPRVGFSGR